MDPTSGEDEVARLRSRLKAVEQENASLRATIERGRDHERFLDSIVEYIPDMIFVKDAEELRFVLFNAAGEGLLGYKRADLIGKRRGVRRLFDRWRQTVPGVTHGV